jgi:hypothetical protein
MILTLGLEQLVNFGRSETSNKLFGESMLYISPSPSIKGY